MIEISKVGKALPKLPGGENNVAFAHQPKVSTTPISDLIPDARLRTDNHEATSMEDVALYA